MAWEKRRNRTYYYQSERVGSRVVKRYVGRGEDAELIARYTAARQELNRAEATRQKKGQEKFREGERLVATFCEQVDILFREAMTAAGYRQHDRGQWRKRRTGKEVDDATEDGSKPISED